MANTKFEKKGVKKGRAQKKRHRTLSLSIIHSFGLLLVKCRIMRCGEEERL